MKFGANTFIWTSPFQTKSFEIVAKIAELGFDVAEIAFEDPSLIDIKKLRSTVQQYGLEVATCGAFGPDRDLISNDIDKRRTAKTYIKTCLDYANALESHVFCGPVYSAVGTMHPIARDHKKVQWQRAIEGLTELGDYAQSRGVTIAVEPLNRFETNFINTATDLKKLINNINHSAIKAHLDTFHMNIEEKSLEQAIITIGNDLAHFHGCENDRGTPGTGNVDWDGVSRGLKKIQYNGFVVIESFSPEVKEIARAAAIWRPLEKNADTLAANGLAFLKQLLRT